MLWRNAGAKSIKESCGRVTYMIIPLNVLDFYKYRTGAIAFEVDSHFIFRKPRAYTKERATVTKERLRCYYFTIHIGNLLSTHFPRLT